MRITHRVQNDSGLVILDNTKIIKKNLACKKYCINEFKNH